MSPTARRGAPSESTDDTLYDRILQGEFGPLIPAGQAAQRLGMQDEALRRYGLSAETLLDCALPTGESGGRMYPEKLLLLMDRAQTEKASGQARSRAAALSELLAAAGWIDAGEDRAGVPDSADMASLRAGIEDLRALLWRLGDLGPRMGGVMAQNLTLMEKLDEALSDVTLEVSQVIPHLYGLKTVQHAVRADTSDLSRQVMALARTASNLAEHSAALQRERGAMRRQLNAAPWLVGLSAGLGGALGGLLVALMHG